jgi:hypothetical protein
MPALDTGLVARCIASNIVSHALLVSRSRTGRLPNRRL